MAAGLVADPGAAPRPEPRAEQAGPAARGWLAVVLIAWIAICALMLAMNMAEIAQLDFRDPDDQLRLQQVRDLLAGQSWFDVRQHRIDPAAGGVAMHWSRLVDLPIAAIILVLSPVTGEATAELAALVAIPALTLLAILAVTGWIAARVLPRGAVPLALLATAFAVPAMLQVMPMRIDHHGWQIVLALVAMAALRDTNERRGGATTGAALAVWMAISFEGLPLSAWFVTVLALVALVHEEARARLVGAMQALAAVSAALFVATRGLGDLANHCDAIAPVHLAMFGWGALAVTVVRMRYPHSRVMLIAGLAAGAAGALALVGLTAPQCASGTFDMLDPVVRAVWYDNVHEGKTIFLSPWHLVAQHLLPSLVALFVLVRLARRAEGWERRWWISYALVMLGALALGMAVARSASYTAAFAAVPLGWQFHAWMTGLKRPANPALRLGELIGVAALIFAILLPVVPVMALEQLAGSAPADKPAGTLACRTRAATGALAALPAGAILAPMDFGPDVIASSDRAVLATGHHRGAAAIRQVIDAFSGSPETARAIMRRNRLRYVMVCAGVQEMRIYRERAPDGFAAKLLDDRAPAWLRPVPLPRASGLRMWELVD